MWLLKEKFNLMGKLSGSHKSQSFQKNLYPLRVLFCLMLVGLHCASISSMGWFLFRLLYVWDGRSAVIPGDYTAIINGSMFLTGAPTLRKIWDRHHRREKAEVVTALILHKKSPVQ